MYEKQPDSLPTNKALVAGGIGSILTAYATPVVQEVWPVIAPTVVAGPQFTTFVAAIVGYSVALAVAWFVPDRAGVV